MHRYISSKATWRKCPTFVVCSTFTYDKEVSDKLEKWTMG